MPFYHIRIVKKNGKLVYDFDLTKDEVVSRLITPINQRKPFVITSSPLEASDIENFDVSKTDENSSTILKKSKWKKRLNTISYFVTGERKDIDSNNWLVFSSGKKVTNLFTKKLDFHSDEKVYPKGGSYDFYKDFRKITKNVNSEVFLIDAWVNEESLDLYLKDVPVGVRIKILTNSPQGNFITVAKKFKNNPKVDFEVRKTKDCHDRLVFIDNQCWVTGQSIKDAGKKPTYLVKIVDSDKFKKIFDSLWEKSTVLI